MRVLAANGPDSFIWWEWVGDHTDEIRDRTIEHFWLTVVAVGIGLLVSGVLAAIALRLRWTYGAILSTTNIIYSIPSLALFGFLIPITGLGFRTAEIALVSYTLLILVRNIVAGLDGVPSEIREAAEGMGYTASQRLWRVELPLAIPVIVAGLRIATVSTIGLMTVAAIIGQGGLGVLILEGLNSFFPTKVYLGAVLSVALAIAADAGFLQLQRRLTPWSVSRVRAA
jgi:osmoprotectant transport system permease protein